MRIAIAGAGGRMGQMLIEAVLSSDDLTLAAAFNPPGTPLIGQDAGAFLGRATGVAVTDDLSALADATGTALVALAGYLLGVTGRVVTARATGTRWWPDALAHPGSVALLGWLTVRSYHLRRRRRLTWRGRPV